MKYFVTVLLLLSLSTAAFSQITLTYDEYLQQQTSGITPSSFTSSDVTGVGTLIAMSGPNQAWDFGSRVFTENVSAGTTTTFAYPGNAPLANDPDLTSSTQVTKFVPTDPTQPTIYSFFKLDQTGYYQTGTVQDSMGVVTKLIGYDPPYQNLKFPLTYPTSWTANSTVHIDLGFPGAVLTQMEEASVDGFGTVVVGSITSPTQCLRLHRKQTQTVSILGFGQTIKSNSYEWLGHTVDVGVPADSNSIPYDVTYSSMATNKVAADNDDPLVIRIVSNPVTTSTSIFVSMPQPGETRVTLIDGLGKNVSVLVNKYVSSGNLTLPLDANHLANGSYFLRVESPRLTGMRKVIVSH
jgi:hypothetical protein